MNCKPLAQSNFIPKILYCWNALLGWIWYLEENYGKDQIKVSWTVNLIELILRITLVSRLFSFHLQKPHFAKNVAISCLFLTRYNRDAM